MGETDEINGNFMWHALPGRNLTEMYGVNEVPVKIVVVSIHRLSQNGGLKFRSFMDIFKKSKWIREEHEQIYALHLRSNSMSTHLYGIVLIIISILLLYFK